LVQQFMSDCLNESALTNARHPGDSNTPRVPAVR
jgi:hypothetical protein